MAEKKKSSFIAAMLRGANQAKHNKSPSSSSDSQSPGKSSTLGRRDSTRLQSAAKLLRSLSKSKDVVSSPNKPEKSPAESSSSSSDSHGLRRRRSASEKGSKGNGFRENRSHSFHGKADRRSHQKRCSLNTSGPPSVGVAPSSPVSVMGGVEMVRSGARSILLTEDNLASLEPDLIQDLPLSSNSRPAPIDDSRLAPVHNGLRHTPLRPSKSLQNTKRAESYDSIHELAESLVADVDKIEDQQQQQEPLYHSIASETPAAFDKLNAYDSGDATYSDNLRYSSYALLQHRDHGSSSRLSTGGGPQSLLPSVIASRFSESWNNHPGSSGGGGGMAGPGAGHAVVPMPSGGSSASHKSLPYMRSPEKTPRTCELEEYARRYEAIQRGTSARRRLQNGTGQQQAHTQQTQQQQQLLHQAPSGGQDMWARMRQQACNGRESVVSTSSGETIKYQDELMPHHQQQQQPVFRKESVMSRESFSNYQNVSVSSYASLPPEPRMHKDLKRFPLQTYPSQSLSTLANGEAGAVGAASGCGGHGDNKENVASSAQSGARPKMRHQMSEKSMGGSKRPPSSASDQLQHSKSVPNLSGAKDASPLCPGDQGGEGTPPAHIMEASFTYLDPEKRMRVTDNTLKLIQRQALLDYYTRHSNAAAAGPASSRRSSSSDKPSPDQYNYAYHQFSSSQQPQQQQQKRPAMDSGFYSPTEPASGQSIAAQLQQQQQQQQLQPMHNSQQAYYGNSEPSAELAPSIPISQEEIKYDDDDLDEELQKVTQGIDESDPSGYDSTEEHHDDDRDDNPNQQTIHEDHEEQEAREISALGDDTDSARPVFLKEHANGYKSGSTSSLIKNEAWHLRQKEQEAELEEEEQQRMKKHLLKERNNSSSSSISLSLSPPERPPKKPHLRGEQPETPPPPKVPSRPTSRTSSSANSSRGATPVARKPKFPSPPGSPCLSGKRPPPSTPTPPPPGPPQATSSGSAERLLHQDLPLPPPPPPSAAACLDESTTLRISDRMLGQSPPLPEKDVKYRRTSSPATASGSSGACDPQVTPQARKCSAPAMDVDKSPVRTPKRESPATIAARGAPGWEKFLGGKTSTHQFTSEELSKLKQPREKDAPKPPPKPSKAKLLPPPTETSFEYSPSPPLGTTPSHVAKSSPSLNQSPSAMIAAKSHLRPVPVWKNSLDSLRSTPGSGPSPVRGFTASNHHAQQQHPSSPRTRQSNSSNNHENSTSTSNYSHSHSNSDSGLSSLSGRTSTMSPISTMSTVSSSSGSSSSSRASLRSASIVSSCTIPLDEEDEVEEEEMMMMLASASPEVASSHNTPGNFQTSRFLKETRRAANNASFNLATEKLPEEIECEELSEELREQIGQNKNLTLLFGLNGPGKTAADHLQGLLNFSELSPGVSNNHHSRNTPSETRLRNRIEVLQSESKKRSLDSRSVPFRNVTASNSRADFKHDSRDLTQGQDTTADSSGITRKKEVLLTRLSHKLDLLRATQLSLKDEVKSNEESGRAITLKVMTLARPNECDKYKLTVEETDKITSLIVGLAGRLAKAENALDNAGEEDSKDSLQSKRDKLLDQLEEARKLKENIDKRANNVSNMLLSYLSKSEFTDYQLFLRTKVKLIVESKEVQEKVDVTEEQIRALKESWK